MIDVSEDSERLDVGEVSVGEVGYCCVRDAGFVFRSQRMEY